MPATRAETEKALEVASIAIVGLFAILEHAGLTGVVIEMNDHPISAEALYRGALEVIRPVNQANGADDEDA